MVEKPCFCSTHLRCEKKIFKRQTGLTCMNVTLLQQLLLLHSHPIVSWHTNYWEYDLHPEWLNVICGNVKSKISNSCPKSRKVFSLWVHRLTSLQSDAESQYSVMCPCPLTSYTSSTRDSWPTTTSALCSCSWLYQCVRRVVTLLITTQNMSFRYELACKDHSTEKARDLVT